MSKLQTSTPEGKSQDARQADDEAQGSAQIVKEGQNTKVLFEILPPDKALEVKEYTAGMTQLERKHIEDIFKEFDVNKDGFIDEEDLKLALRKTGRDVTDVRLLNF
jgi:hypothetical protein